MKSVIKLLFLFVVFTPVLTACSKEQKIENKLVRGSGKWNIRKLNKSSTSNYTVEHLDAGSFEFHKDKTIIKTINLSTTKVDTGIWSNNENQIHVTWSDGKKTTFDVKKEVKRNLMTLTESYPVITTTNYGTSGSSQLTSTVMNRYYLERTD